MRAVSSRDTIRFALAALAGSFVVFDALVVGGLLVPAS